MKANSLSYHMQGYWKQRMLNSLYGFNVDPLTNRIDEYERYNRIRRERYAVQDARFAMINRCVAVALVMLLGALFFV